MDTYVVIEIENHPDNSVESVRGPFPDYDAARTYAQNAQLSPDNKTPDGFTRSIFYIRDMIAP